MIQKEYETADDEPIESLRVRIKLTLNPKGMFSSPCMTSIVLGVCYTQPHQEEVDEAYKKPHIHKPVFLWGMLTIPISAGREHSRAQAMQEVSGAHG